MKNMNAAQQIYASFGGLGHLVAVGYFIDKTTMPKSKRLVNEDEAIDGDTPKKKEVKISYGKSLMAHFDLQRKTKRDNKRKIFHLDIGDTPQDKAIAVVDEMRHKIRELVPNTKSA